MQLTQAKMGRPQYAYYEDEDGFVDIYTGQFINWYHKPSKGKGKGGKQSSKGHSGDFYQSGKGGAKRPFQQAETSAHGGEQVILSQYFTPDFTER